MTLSAILLAGAAEIRFRLVWRLGFVVGLYVLAYFLTGNPDVLSVAVLGGGLYIASEGLGLGSRWIAYHYLLGVATFLGLYAAIGLPWLFALLCGLLALGVIALTRLAADLRTFGNWIFIPAVYLACELGENRDWAWRLATLPQILLVSLIGPAAVIGLYFSRRKRPSKTLASLLAKLGNPNFHWKRQAAAAFASVVSVAGAAMAFHLPNSQWMIWSSLSTIAIDLPASRERLRARMTGALIGCPAGFLVGLALPHDPLTYALATMGILLTLVAFRTYVFGFTARCALTALAAVVAGGTVDVAGQRVVNVIVGGIIGVVAQHLAEWRAGRAHPSRRGD